MAASPDAPVRVRADTATWAATGRPDAPAIVFVHGTRLSRAQWDGQVRRLSHEFLCIALDLPGHGVLADRDFTLEGAADHVAAVITAAAPGGRAAVVGLSLGGYVAIEAAVRHPDRVTGLVLAGCSADPIGPTGFLFRLFASILAHAPTSVGDTVNAAFFRTVYGRAVADPIIAGGFHPRGGAHAIRSLVGRRFSVRVFGLWTPILFINGALDPVFGPGGAGWALASRDGRHRVIGRAGHLSDLDRPAVFAALVRDFARRLAPGA